MPAILLVDDRPENLVALRAILEPLGHELVAVGSGEEALRALLRRDDFAVVLLDAQMPRMDGFETAETIKQRDRTKNIPIIFLTAISKEEEHVFRGYEVGAVDYVFKPLNPDVMRGKVSVFVELYEKNEELRHQRELIAFQELAAVRREGTERYRQLADAMPQIVWTADANGRSTYYNRRFVQYTGVRFDLADGDEWPRILHPDDLEHALARRAAAIANGAVFEAEYRLRAADGSYRWHLGRAVPIHDRAGGVDFWIGTATDIDDRKRLAEVQQFLLDAGAELSRSLDYRATLGAVARLAVPRIADWFVFHRVEADGSVVEICAAPARPEGEAAAVEAAVAARRASFDLDAVRVLLEARGRTIGVVSLGMADSRRTFDESDFRCARAFAQSSAAAVDNALLYEEAEQRARASRALETIADGVALLDNDGTVLLWNRAAETITGLRAEDVVGRDASESLPLSAQAAAAKVPLDGSRAETVPVELGGRELWLSLSRVRFGEGTVYAFRDVTEARRFEQMRADMLATVSHELRTPLAAIYGAAMTLDERSEQIDGVVRHTLLRVVAEESERLAQIVGEVLLANQLDSGFLRLAIETVNALELTRRVVDAARAHLPASVSVEIEVATELPPVAADEQHLRQVLVNLVENAVKYSPDGGTIQVALTQHDRFVQWAVRDEGLGIPPSERRRVFEKFYRLDPNMTRGIGGTGLGLYICRELVQRLDGRIWVEPNEGRGSVFFVRIPAAGVPAPRPRARAARAAA
jgi:PAS domain S-box-containing protein